jgi:rubrerythrin
MEGFRVSIWKELKHRVEKGVETASQKSQQMVEISRLNLRIRGKKEDINRLYRRLGILAYEAWKEDPAESLAIDGEIKEVLESIRQLQTEITAMEQDLLLVRGKIDCPACGAVVDRGTDQCPVCQATIHATTTLSPEKPVSEVEPQASDETSRHRQSESSASPSESPEENGKEARGKEQTSVAPNSQRALTEFQTVTGEAIFICPECGNQLKELVNTCPHCGEKFL